MAESSFKEDCSHIFISLSCNVSTSTLPPDVADDLSVFSKVSFAIMFIVIIFALIGNLLIVYVVWTKPNMVTTHNFYVANLAVVDTIFISICSVVDVIGIGYIAFYGSIFNETRGASAFILFAEVLTYTGYCGTLIVLAFDKFLSISRPLDNKTTRTMRSARIQQGTVWTVSIVLGVIVAVLECMESTHVVAIRCSLYSFVVFYCGLIFFMAGCYVAIFRSVREQEFAEGDKVARWQLRRNMQMLRMVNALVITFVICHGLWLGYGLYAHHANYYKGAEDKTRERLRLDIAMRIVVRVACALNSAVNPLIYGTLTSDFRRHLRQIVYHPFATARPIRRGTTDSTRQSMVVINPSSTATVD